MGQQIRIFEKNIIDFNNQAASIEVIDIGSANNGQDIVDFVRSRKNINAWVTSGSADSYNTKLEVTLGGVFRIADIILIAHNFKSFTIDYWDAGWTNLVTETTNIKTTSHFSFTEILTEKIRIVIGGTIIVDANKFLKQLIITRPFKQGQLESWPIVTPVLDQNKKVTEMLSGKVNISQSLGGYSIDLKIASCESVNDIELFQEMYNRFYEGFLIWCNAGDDLQFRTSVQFWKSEDIFLVRPVDSYNASWYEGIYSCGIPIKIKLKEVIR